MKQFYHNKTTLELSSKLLELNKKLKKYEQKRMFKIYTPEETKIWIKEKGLILNKIPYIELTKLLAICTQNHSYTNEIINYNTINISPIDIPIIRENEKFDYGQFTPLYLDKDGNNLIFTEFRLSKLNTYITPIVYIHEIIHSLIENNENSISNFIDYELCPIIFEFMLSYDLGEEVYKKNIDNRMNSLKDYIDILKINDTLGKYYASSYINSILLTLDFISKYVDSSNSIKKEMSTFMQDIICDNETVYSMLNKYDISYETALNKILMKGGL